MEHFNALRSLCSMKLMYLHRYLDTANVSSSFSMVTCILDDKAIVKGNVYKVLRLFVRTQDSKDLANVGWILEENIFLCLLCGRDFKHTSDDHKKFHCHACGNLVCEKCISVGQLEGLEEDCLPVNTCIQCNFGQVIYYCLIL